MNGFHIVYINQIQAIHESMFFFDFSSLMPLVIELFGQNEFNL